MPANAETISYYTSFAAPDVAPSTRFTAAVRRGSNTATKDSGAMPATWDVEELVAMQLAYIRTLAVDAAGPGERVQDVVVTVPAFFSQFERDAIADAVELAGLRLMALMNDGTAVAVNYAMTRQFPEPERPSCMMPVQLARVRRSLPSPDRGRSRIQRSLRSRASGTIGSLGARSSTAVCAKFWLKSSSIKTE